MLLKRVSVIIHNDNNGETWVVYGVLYALKVVRIWKLVLVSKYLS